MKWFQKQISLSSRSRGFHLVTREVLNEIPELRELQVGMLQVFIQHTSASLTLNENASPEVLADFESHFNATIRENEPYYKHTLEGSDDMPAHIKASLLGSSLQLPIQNGGLALGIWQGIYLCEHRNHGGARNLMLTAWGEESP
jgi:secondary thiamine-phosphate synthase enzyme